MELIIKFRRNKKVKIKWDILFKIYSKMIYNSNAYRFYIYVFD